MQAIGPSTTRRTFSYQRKVGEPETTGPQGMSNIVLGRLLCVYMKRVITDLVGIDKLRSIMTTLWTWSV